MHELRYILLVFLEVGKNDYTSNGQGTFYNEKLGPNLAQNQKRCKFTPLALARKLNLMTFSSNWENIHLLGQVKKNAFNSVEVGGEKKSQPGGRKKIFFQIFKRLLSCFNPS